MEAAWKTKGRGRKEDRDINTTKRWAGEKNRRWEGMGSGASNGFV
jgi:hypothetical protein